MTVKRLAALAILAVGLAALFKRRLAATRQERERIDQIPATSNRSR